MYNEISFPVDDKQHIQAGIIKISVIKECPEDVLEGPGPVRLTHLTGYNVVRFGNSFED